MVKDRKIDTKTKHERSWTHQPEPKSGHYARVKSPNASCNHGKIQPALPLSQPTQEAEYDF